MSLNFYLQEIATKYPGTNTGIERTTNKCELDLTQTVWTVANTLKTINEFVFLLGLLALQKYLLDLMRREVVCMAGVWQELQGGELLLWK
jgi:hypothetical protein